MIVQRHFYFADGAAYVSYEYDDANADANGLTRVLRLLAVNNAPLAVRFVGTRYSDGAVYALTLQPGEPPAAFTLSNNPQQRIFVDISVPNKPRPSGWSLDGFYPA